MALLASCELHCNAVSGSFPGKTLTEFMTGKTGADWTAGDYWLRWKTLDGLERTDTAGRERQNAIAA